MYNQYKSKYTRLFKRGVTSRKIFLTTIQFDANKLAIGVHEVSSYVSIFCESLFALKCKFTIVVIVLENCKFAQHDLLLCFRGLITRRNFSPG